MPKAHSATHEGFDTGALFTALADASPRAARHKVFEALTQVDPYELDGILLKRQPVPEHASARSIMRNLGALLELRSSEVADILNISESRVSRNDQVSIPILDRTFAVSDVFAQVSAVLGPEYARAWFKAPNLALDGAAPLKLLGTHYGEKKVENLVTALLNGAVV